MNIEDDLRVTCKHGNGVGHEHPETWGTRRCPGGRVPTRQELIDMIGIDYESLMHELTLVVAAYVLDDDYWGPIVMRQQAQNLMHAALGGGT